MNEKKIQCFFRLGSAVYFHIFIFVLIAFYSTTAKASLIDDVSIDAVDSGYEIKVDFELLIRYQRHTPDKASNFFRIELSPVNLNRLDVASIASLKDRLALSWNRKTGIPLKDITYEGRDPGRPQMDFAFTEDVEIGVRNSSDLRSLIISVKTDKVARTKSIEEAAQVASNASKEKLENDVISNSSMIEKDIEMVVSDKIDTILESNGVDFMEMAKNAMIEGDYRRAIRYYTKILRKAEGETKRQAQELLGLARERNDQFAHAKSEYKKYLNNYPDGPDAVRVRQRLAGLVTAVKTPKKRIVRVREPRKVRKKPKWQVRNYGSFSNFYYRDQTSRDGETNVSRNDIFTSLNLNSKWTSEDYDIRYKYSGRHQREIDSGELDENRLSALSFEVRHKKSGLYGKIGRQSRNSGGVLGRFDGVHVSYDITPKVVVNGIFGFPVESTKQTTVETDKRVYGISTDFGTYNEHWDYTAFVIAQDDSGMIDRFAVGGEVRYFDSKKSFYTLFDYDLFFREMNVFLFNGAWSVTPKTTLNLRYDYRRSPVLTANNAVQGQNVAGFKDLSDKFSEDEIRELAVDRSAISKTFTFGVTQKFSDDVQLTSDLAVSRLEGTVASGGVDAMPGTGNEYYFSTRLDINNVFFENDSIVNSLRLSDTSRRNTYTYDISTRIPFNRKFRMIPRFRVDYRTEKEDDDTVLTLQPRMRLDYRLTKWARLEVEGGIEWKDEKSSGVSSNSTRSFLSLGYRLTF